MSAPMLKKILGIVFALLALLFLAVAIQNFSSAPSILALVAKFLPTGFFALLAVFCLQKAPVATPAATPEQPPVQ